MIDFSTLQELTIPEGVVTEIADAQGRVLWSYGSPAILEVEKQTLTTYAGETEYENEEFILLDIYPKNANSTVNVTYGGLIKTLEFSGTNAQQVYFGTFNGVSDSVETPASGTLTIEGGYKGFGVGTYQTGSKLTGKSYCSCITNVSKWGTVNYIPNYAFYKCRKLTTSPLPNDITSIGSHAFQYCVNLALTSLPNGIPYINDYTFQGCAKLALTELPSSITSIGVYAFNGCKNIEISVIPEGVTTIGSYAFFMDDMELTKMWKAEITLPSTIQSIYDSSFMGEENLLVQPGTYWYPTSVTILAVVPPALYYASGAIGNVEKITVPKGCGEAYKAAEGWSRYANYIVELSE